MSCATGICDKTSNNKYFDCPPLMSDGRMFTDYRPNCYVNNLVRMQNQTYSSYEYRQFLINNAEQFMKLNSDYCYQKNGCKSCNATPIEDESRCNVNRRVSLCSPYGCEGLGRGYRGDSRADPQVVYQPQLQDFSTMPRPMGHGPRTPDYVVNAAMPGQRMGNCRTAS